MVVSGMSLLRSLINFLRDYISSSSSPDATSYKNNMIKIKNLRINDLGGLFPFV